MQKLLYLFLLLSLNAFGQTTTANIHADIRNTKTGKHILIPGTRLYIIPPPDFKITTTFTGLKKGESSMFMMYDVVGGNIDSNAATFNQAEFEKQGAKVLDFKEIKVDGFSGRFIHLQGDPTTKAYAIVFGDTTFTTMIMTVYPVNDEKTGNDILKALNTVYYDKNKKIDPFATANFSFDENVSRFKFFRYNANLYIYSIDGKDNKDDKEAPVVFILQIPIDKTMTAKSVTDAMIAKIQQYGFTNPEIKSTSAEKINDYDAYQAEVYGQMNGENSLIYYCVLIKNDNAIVVQGIAKTEIEINRAEFKKMANAVQLK
jgi:hypothetical protein